MSQASGQVGYQLDAFGKSVSAGSAWAAGAVGRTAGDLRRAVGSSMAEAAAGVAEAVGSASHAAGRAGRAFGRAVTTPVHLARVRLSKREVRTLNVLDERKSLESKVAVQRATDYAGII
jgi:hypothetical protein